MQKFHKAGTKPMDVKAVFSKGRITRNIMTHVYVAALWVILYSVLYYIILKPESISSVPLKGRQLVICWNMSLGRDYGNSRASS